MIVDTFNMLLKRDDFKQDATLGKLFINDVFECHTLEDTDRHIESTGVKIDGRTAIPRGKYKVIINESQRFKRRLPLILQVPWFEGIRIHSGNTSADTEGCILVGVDRLGASVTQSRLAFDSLFNKLEAAERRGIEIWLSIQ